MYTDVSESYIERIGELSREFRARLSFSDTQDVVSDEIQSMQFTFGTCGAETFTIGSVFISYVTATVAKTDLQIAGQEFTPEIGLVLDNTVEYIPMGIYEASPSGIVKTKDRIQITASDRIGTRCSGLYVPAVTFPATIQAVINDISSQAGVTIRTSEDATGTITKRLDTMTCQEALGYIAGLIGGFCYADRCGDIILAVYPSQPALAVAADRIIGLNVAETDHLISTLSVTVSEGGEDPDGETVDPVSYQDSTGSSGDYLAVANPYMTAEIFAVMKNKVLDYSYRPGTAIFLGDPRIDPVDALELSDSDDIRYFFPCMSLVTDYDGGLTSTITTPGLSSSDNTAVGPLAQKIDKIAASQILAEQVIARKISASQADLRYAKIDFANVGVAAMESLYTNFGVVKNIQIVDGKITGELDAVSVNGDLIKANTIVADRIVFTGTDGMYYALNANGAGGLTPQQLTDEKYQHALDGSNLVAQSVTADRIDVTDLFAQSIQFTGTITSKGKRTVKDNINGILIDGANGTIGIGSNAGNHIWFDGQNLNIKADSLTFSSGFDVEQATTEAVEAVSDMQDRMDSGEFKGEDAVVLRIDSSRGTVFKNNAVSTVLTVAIYTGGQRITNITDLRSKLGNSAHLQWYWQRLNDDSYGVIVATDPRLSDDGFSFTLTPTDVDTKVTFMCELITD